MNQSTTSLKYPSGQSTKARIREVATGGGFMRFRRATETPVNFVFEAKQ